MDLRSQNRKIFFFLQNRSLTPKMPKRVPESDSEEEATARERRGSKKKNNVKSAVKAR